MGSTTKRIQYRYDSRGNRVGMTDPDGGRFTYAYDAVNRMSHIINPQGERTTYAYDAAGRRTVKKLANGTRTSFGYDATGNLTKLANLKGDGTTISSFEYGYDSVGTRTSVVEADGSRVTWSYDSTYQLTGEHRTGSNAYRNTFAYDPAGNRTLKVEDGARTTYVYDAASQMTRAVDASGITTYVYDGNGNREVVIKPNGDRTTTMWDFENRPKVVQQPSGERSTMTYAPDGLRVKLEEPTETKKFVWDEQNYLAETDENDDTQVVYTNEPRVYGNLVSQRRATDSHWYHFDALGSTRELTDLSQVVTDTRLYDAWGVFISSTGSNDYPFAFIGRVGYYVNSDSATFCVRARRYSPTLGRWDSRDTTLLLVGQRYLYAANRPVALVDPSGVQPVQEPSNTESVGQCTASETQCIRAAIQDIKNAFSRNRFCLEGAQIVCPTGRPSCDWEVLGDCIQKSLDALEFRCQDRGHGGCHPESEGVKNRAHTTTLCGMLKGIATQPLSIPPIPALPIPFSPFVTPPLPGCEYAACEYPPSFMNDCSACPFPLMALDTTDLCRDVAPDGMRIGSYCDTAEGRRNLVKLLVHEASHMCVGGHDTTGGRGKCDSCRRPDSYDIDAGFMRACLPMT